MSKNKKQSAEAVPEEKTEAAGSEEKTEAEQPAAPEQDSKEAAEKQTEAEEKKPEEKKPEEKKPEESKAEASAEAFSIASRCASLIRSQSPLLMQRFMDSHSCLVSVRYFCSHSQRELL